MVSNVWNFNNNKIELANPWVSGHDLSKKRYEKNPHRSVKSYASSGIAKDTIESSI